MNATPVTFEAWAYRTSARYGSRVTISVAGDSVSVAGPRISASLYRLWEAAQWILLALVPLSVACAIAFKSWWWLLGTLVAALAHLAVGGLGAASLWEMMNLIAFGQGTAGETTTFPKSAVQRVRIGAGWARGATQWMIFPYVPGINQMAAGLCVSFEAPGGVYALHMRAPADAQALAAALGA